MTLEGVAGMSIFIQLYAIILQHISDIDSGHCAALQYMRIVLTQVQAGHSCIRALCSSSPLWISSTLHLLKYL